jgi:AcrR family transcriptional regulator
MPNKERRKREKEELRQQILDVAKDIAAADGWQNVTIRKICDKIHYTAPVVYQYFESKEMILESLRLEGIKQMQTIFEMLDKKYTTPEKRLQEYGLAWWRFAQQHPELYQVMYNLQGAVCAGNTNNISTIVEHYSLAFSAINQKAKRSEKFRLELCDHLIAIIHGFIALKMVNKIKSGNENAEQVYKNSLQRYIDSIKNKKTTNDKR